MPRTQMTRLSIAAILLLGAWPALSVAQSMNPQQALSWQSVRAPFTPGAGAVAGGSGDSPAPNSPMFICRAEVQGSVTPGKWVNGNCNVAYDGREITAHDYQVAYGNASWRQFNTFNRSDLIQTGNEADGTPLYSCRVRYKDFGRDVGYQPGKIVPSGQCHIAYGGRETVVTWPFEALYAGNTGTPAVAGSANAGHAGQRGVPLCKPSDTGVLMQGRTWQGPNCIPVDVMTGQPVHATPLPASDHAERIGAASNKPRDLCRKGDPDVTLTAAGYAGPDCITSNEYGEVATYGNATPEERARLRPCEPGADGVHVENGMLVGADCKSVPEPKAPAANTDPCAQSTFGIRNGNQVTTGNRCQKAEKADAEKAAADERAAREAAAQKQAEEKAAKEAEANAAKEKSDAEKAAALQKAFADQAAADQKKAEQEKADQAAEAAHKAQEAAAQEAEAKAAKEQEDREKAEQLQKAFAEQAARDKAAAEQKQAEEEKERQAAEAAHAAQEAAAKEAEAKAAKEKEDQEKAEQLKKAFEEQAAAKAAKDKEDEEKMDQLKKAFEDQAAKQKAESSAPASSSDP